MKRRSFLKTTASVSIGMPLIPRGVYQLLQHENVPLPILKYTLKGFDNEREESPSVVSNDVGEMWLFSLRRFEYPQNEEIISCFKFNGTNWIESKAVTKKAGQFEAPVAACAPNGKPAVAWAEIKNENWVINISHMQGDSFSKPYTFQTKLGNSTNPVLIAPQKNRIWLAWENLHEGKFTIHVCKYVNKKWSKPVVIEKEKESCFDPAIAESADGNLYIAYGLTDGLHQNIEMSIIDGKSLDIREYIPVAIGGGRSDRVNINARPALAFDNQNNLWISFENNRNSTRLNDGDNYSGDRSCAILSYTNGEIQEVVNQGKWLFDKMNDHKPTFIKDKNGNLFVATHCGGDFTNHGWKYRLSWLDPYNGWQEPIVLHDAKIKGFMMTPALAFDSKNNIWLATINDLTFKNYEKVKSEGIVNSRLTELNLHNYKAVKISNKQKEIKLIDTQIIGFLPDENSISTFSGRPRVERKQIKVGEETYTLLYGNLHDHTNSSNCWPAGCDGTLHENYRYGMFGEGYDFIGMTDHAASTSEVHWRRNIRTADFYNESKKFVAIPAVEWTLQSDSKLDHIQHGAGHYNIVFESTGDAQKYIRNRHEIYCPHTPETKIAPLLWKMLDDKQVKCVTIPHHPADKVHPIDWNVTDPKYVTTVEIFQCRGNNEYPGCPREKNLERHTPTQYKHAYVNHALKEKAYKMGFIASGDHNNMGIGLAALWVKEVSRKGIIEALKSRRTFATTGDKMFIDFRINNCFMGETSRENGTKMNFEVIGQYPLEKVEILKNSQVIQTFDMENDTLNFTQSFIDHAQIEKGEVLYYYLRATQKNKAIGWSSPIWVEEV